MKKTVALLGLLALFTVFGCFYLGLQNRTVQLQVDEHAVPVLYLKAEGRTEKLEIWLNKREGIYYFFLPSFVPDNRVFCDTLTGNDIALDGKLLSRWNSFEWEEEKVYTLGCGERKYEVVFMKSSNLPALFVETESGSMEYLDSDKENEESGKITLIKQTKNVEYTGELKKISARGNSTFDNKGKKAYSFTLENGYPLCGLDAGKKWNLLALALEYDKIHTKLVCDMAEYLGMEYNVDGTWVDLYCNGEYKGLYLLTETVNVGKGRVEIRDLDKVSEENTDISGGYLIEKDVEVHLEEEGNGFITENCGYPFVLKSPKIASESELAYIKDYIQNIEDLLVAGDEKYKEYIDMDSFAKQFLIDKIVMEPDAMNMSTFYYKEAGSDILKAAPLWDYDRAFGEAIPYYDLTIGDYPNGMWEWYMQLYSDEEFKEKMLLFYQELLPFLDEILESGIDGYVEYIADSVQMDAKMWPNQIYQTSMMSYLQYDSYIKYLKFFIASRLNFLNELWGITGYEFEVPASSGTEHKVQFIMDDGAVIKSGTVTDGSCIEELPALDGEKYGGWSFYEDGKLYDVKIPIYEDTVFYAERQFDNMDERREYKVGKLQSASGLTEYMTALADDDFSVCIYINEGSGMAGQADAVTALKEVCDYKYPDWLEEGMQADKDYFLLIDNGWNHIWDSIEGDLLEESGTTFGKVSFGAAEGGERYLYIREEQINYLSETGEKDVTFVVIDRYSGEIVDSAIFDEGIRINQVN